MAKQKQTQPAEPETSSVYERGQTVIPKRIREAAAIEYGTQLRWEVREGTIRVVPIPKHPAQALRGSLKGTGLTWQTFMTQRAAERKRERQQEKLEAKRWRTSSTRQR